MTKLEDLKDLEHAFGRNNLLKINPGKKQSPSYSRLEHFPINTEYESFNKDPFKSNIRSTRETTLSKPLFGSRSFSK